MLATFFSSMLLAIALPSENQNQALTTFITDHEEGIPSYQPFSPDFQPMIQGHLDLLSYFIPEKDEASKMHLLQIQEGVKNYFTLEPTVEPITEALHLLKTTLCISKKQWDHSLKETLIALEESASEELEQLSYPKRLYLFGKAFALDLLYNEYSALTFDFTLLEQFDDVQDTAEDLLFNPTDKTQKLFLLAIQKLKRQL
jgi:hypothetical protein